MRTERIDYHNSVDERINRDGDMDMGKVANLVCIYMIVNFRSYGKTPGILHISKLGWMNPSSYQARVWVAVQEQSHRRRCPGPPDKEG